MAVLLYLADSDDWHGRASTCARRTSGDDENPSHRQLLSDVGMVNYAFFA